MTFFVLFYKGSEWENGGKGGQKHTLSHNMNSEGDIQDSIGELLHPEVKYFLRTRQAFIRALFILLCGEMHCPVNDGLLA